MNPGDPCVRLTGGTVMTDGADGRIRDLLICDGTVAAACRRPSEHRTRQRDVAGRIVAPGLVDVHAHGAVGEDFATPDPYAWRAVLAAHLRAGTTSLLATLASDDPHRMRAAAETGAALHAAGHTPSLAGVHLEGPCLALAQAGAQTPAHLRHPSDAAELFAALPPLVRMVTLAPELPGALDLIGRLAADGVTVSAGHSEAGGEVLRAAQDAGLRHLAHLWSGQSQLTRRPPQRIPGLLECALASDGLTAEVIADGHHLPGELLTIALRCLGPERLCLVSDGTAGAGRPAGARYTVGAADGIVRDGYGTLEDGSSFCGSTVFLGQTLPVARALMGAETKDVIRMATRTPAEAAGLFPRLGSLRPGAAGDVVLLDSELRVQDVMLRGRWVTPDPEPSGVRDVPVS